MTFYHIILPSVWAKHEAARYYTPDTFAEETFIHLSTKIQVQDTLNRYYATENEILVLQINGEPLMPDIKFELAPNG